MRYHGKALRFAVLKIAHILVHVLLIIGFFEFSWEEIFPKHFLAQWKSRPLVAIFGANLAASALITAMMLRDMRWGPSIALHTWQQMMRYATPLVWVALAGVLNQYAYTVLLKYGMHGHITANVAAMGVYSAAFKLSLLLALFTTAFNYAAEPFFFRHMHRHDKRAIYADVARAYALAAVIVITGLLFSMDLLQYLLGGQFRQALHLVPILLGAFYFLGLYYNFSVWYKITDQTRFGAYIATVGVGVTFAVSLWLIPRIGMAGAAWAALACYSTMAALAWWWGRRYMTTSSFGYSLPTCCIPFGKRSPACWQLPLPSTPSSASYSSPSSPSPSGVSKTLGCKKPCAGIEPNFNVILTLF